jgi:uncharacterized protein (DUF302 family)
MQAHTASETFEAPSQARTKHLPNVPVREARARLRRALQAEGFAMVADIDLASMLNRRLDADIEPYFIVEACHPLLAQQALAVAWDGGLLMPTKLCLWKEGNGSGVSVVRPTRLAAAIGRTHLLEVAGRIDERLDDVFDLLDQEVSFEEVAAETAPSIALDGAERATLRDATRRHIDELMKEVAKTDSHPLQHELAQTIDRLEAIARKIDGATGSGQ